MKCRKRIRRCQNRGMPLPPGSARENPEACPSGIRHVGGAKLNQALVRNVRTCRSDAKGDVQAAHTARTRVPKRSTGGVWADRAANRAAHTRGKPRLLDVGRRIPARDRFAPDSPLEGTGFEPVWGSSCQVVV